MRYTYDDFKFMNKLALECTPMEKSFVKSKESLLSVVSHPYQSVFGRDLYPTDFDKIFCTYFMLVKKHCFGNGNKRTAVLYLDLSLMSIGLFISDFDGIVGFTTWVATLPYTDKSYDLALKGVKRFISFM